MNIAITGRSGTGKSSFINAVFRKWTDKPGPAKTGFTETTMEIVGYAHPNNPNIVLWDVAGVCAEKLSQENYLHARLYDLFIVMTAGKFTEIDACLGRELLARKIAVVFVRTKIAIDVETSKHDDPDINEKIVLDIVKESMIEECGKLKEGVEVFLIDSHRPEMYEFDDLETCIEQKISGLKGQSLLLSVSSVTKDMLMLKIRGLRSKIRRRALCACLIGTIPGFGFFTDEWMVRVTAQYFMFKLGLILTKSHWKEDQQIQNT